METKTPLYYLDIINFSQIPIFTAFGVWYHRKTRKLC